MNPRRPLRAVLVCALLMLAGCGGQGEEKANRLVALTPPDTSRLDPVVAEALADAWREFQASSADASGAGLAQAYGRLGLAYQANYLPVSARDCYENAIRLAPGQSQWRYYLGFLLEEAGETGAAVEAYREAIRLAPDYLPARLRAAGLLLNLGQLDAAEAELRSVLDRQPDNAVALAGAGRIALARGDFGKAHEALSRALQRQPRATRLYHPLGLALRGLGRTAEAEEAFARRGATEAVSADPLLEALRESSRSAQSYMTRATAAAQDGRYDIAARAFSEAVALDPDNHLARAGLAQALERLGRYDEALEEANKALELAPGHALTRFQKGRLLERREQDEAASAEYRLALEADPDYAEARLLLGNALMRMGDSAGAIAQYERASQGLPHSVPLLYRLGLAQVAAGRCDTASDTLRRASEQNPSYGPVVEALVRNAATCSAAGERDRLQALEDGRWLYQQLPNAAHAEALAMAFAANGMWDEALETQRAAMQSVEGEAGYERRFMQLNLERYRQRRPAAGAWPDDARVFYPPRAGTR